MFALHGFMLGSGAQNSNFKMQDMSYTVLSQNQNVKIHKLPNVTIDSQQIKTRLNRYIKNYHLPNNDINNVARTMSSLVYSSATRSFGHNTDIFITGDWKLPAVMIGFGMFLLFDRVTFNSRIINRIAQSAFAVYSITDYATSKELPWNQLFNLKNLYQQPFAILRILSILLAIYAACTLLDFIRQALFAITIDRCRGRWFELLWNKASSWTTA